MDNILVTENRKEMIEIGRKIFSSKPDTYRPIIIEGMKKHIDRIMPTASNEQKDNVFYQSIYDFWVYGTNIGEEFFYGFLNKSHAEKAEYITFRTRLIYAGHLNNKELAHKLLDDKYMTYKVLTPFFKRDVVLVNNKESYEEFKKFISKHTEFVVKPLSLGLAVGVHKDNVTNYIDDQTLFKRLLDDALFYKNNYRWGGDLGVVLEEIIPQDKRMAVLHPGSANAIRITTVKAGNKVHIWYPWIKMGVNGEFVTSGALNSINASVNASTGVLDTDAQNEYLDFFTNHPNTQVKIKGFQVPEWASLVSMVKELALKFEEINYIGWDMVLTPNGWCVMEANPEGEFLGQLYHKRGMKKEFEKIIGWKPEKEFWEL